VWLQFSTRILKRLFELWKAKFKQKKRAAWREDMRQKMKVIKWKSELRIKREAWTKWQRLLLLQRAQKHYEVGLLSAVSVDGKKRLLELESLEQRADMFLKEADFKLLDRLWHQWKFNTVLRRKYLIMARRVESRILADALDKWKTRM
jgi:protein SFI1